MLTWFITGASRGFGRAVALEALHRGDQVVATARTPSTIEHLRQLGGERVQILPLDVTDPEQVSAAVRDAERHFGAIDVLFNNAGIGYFAAVEESDDAEVRRMFEINLFGSAAVTKAVLPAMRARRAGTILIASSIAGIRSAPAIGWYSASKFALEGLSEALARELEPLGIKVVLIEPSRFATDWAGSSAAETAPERVIADYDKTAGAQRRMYRAQQGSEEGDPLRAAEAIVNIAHDPCPPLRLPLGNFAYDGTLAKFDAVRRDIVAREGTSRAADRLSL